MLGIYVKLGICLSSVITIFIFKGLSSGFKFPSWQSQTDFRELPKPTRLGYSSPPRSPMYWALKACLPWSGKVPFGVAENMDVKSNRTDQTERQIALEAYRYQSGSWYWIGRCWCVPKYFTTIIDPGTERVGRKEAIAQDCYCNCRKAHGFQ